MTTRITEAQAKLLFGGGKHSRGKARVAKPKASLPENIVESQILGFLRVKGWIVTRNHVTTAVPYYVAVKLAGGAKLDHRNVMRIGEKGMADYTCARPVSPGVCEYFHLETKAPGEEPSQHQRLWMDRQNAVGVRAVWFSDYDEFLRWYKATFGGRA